MQKWITLPFGPRKKERRRERKKEGHNEQPVGRSAGRCRRLLLRAHNGHKGARSLARLFYAVISVRGTDATRTDTDVY